MDSSLTERLTSFKKAYQDMTSTGGLNSYNTSGFSTSSKTTSYTKDEATEILQSGGLAELRELSKFYFYSSGFYRRFNTYYATLLKYAGVTIPHMVDPKNKITDKNCSNLYYKASSFMDSLPLFDMCSECVLKVLVEGSYYGLIKDENNQLTFQTLPNDYCRSRFKSLSGIDVVEMDMSYFDKIREVDMRKAALSSFPKEVQKGYRIYKKDSSKKWVFLPEDQTIYLKLLEEKPFFLNIIPAIIDLEDYRALEKEKDEQEIKKILIQKVPITNSGDLVFEPEEAVEMHRGSVNMLRKNKDIDVLTTYTNVSLESMSDTRQAISNNLEKIEKTIYSEAGVSKQLFSADGNLSLEKSLQNDLALMMVLADEISFFFSNYLTNKYKSNKINFSYKILPISFYNNKEYSENAYKLATAGYSALIPSLTCGINQTNLLDLKNVENELLHLDKVLVPLQTSYTQSGKGKESSSSTAAGASKEDNGAPSKEETDKSEKTIANEVSLDSGGSN